MSGASEGVALLPCPNPWCEGAEGVEASRHIVSGKWHICCDDCMIESPWADSYDLAIAAWNTRTPPPSRSYAEGVEDADVARIIDPDAWSRRAGWIEIAADPKTAEMRDHWLARADGCVANSLAKAAAIRLLSQGGKA